MEGNYGLIQHLWEEDILEGPRPRRQSLEKHGWEGSEKKVELAVGKLWREGLASWFRETAGPDESAGGYCGGIVEAECIGKQREWGFKLILCIPASPFPDCSTPGNLLNLPGPQFPYLQNGSK